MKLEYKEIEEIFPGHKRIRGLFLSNTPDKIVFEFNQDATKLGVQSEWTAEIVKDLDAKEIEVFEHRLKIYAKAVEASGLIKAIRDEFYSEPIDSATNIKLRAFIDVFDSECKRLHKISLVETLYYVLGLRDHPDGLDF